MSKINLSNTRQKSLISQVQTTNYLNSIFFFLLIINTFSILFSSIDKSLFFCFLIISSEKELLFLKFTLEPCLLNKLILIASASF